MIYNKDIELLQNHLHLLKKIEGRDIAEVNETDSHYEFIYIKDKQKYSLVLACCGFHNKFSETTYHKFEVSTEPLLLKFEATSCNSTMREFALKKSEAFESLARIKKIHFHTKSSFAMDTDTLVIEGVTKNGNSLNYFINIMLYDNPVVTTSKYRYLTELGVEDTIRKYGITSFLKPEDILSQWYLCRFTDEKGAVYNSAEQYMMAHKAKLFYDDKMHKKIMNQTDMNTIKKLGKEVQNYRQEQWDAHKESIAYKANLLKFSQNTELTAYLLNTGKSMIIEVNPNDIVWACGCFERDVKTPELWRGKNLLGHILMRVRKDIQEETEHD